MIGQTPSPFPPDSVRVALDRIFDRAEYEWRDVPPDFFRWLRSRITDLNDWLDALLADHPVLYWTLLASCLVVLAAILVHFGVLVFRALKGPREADARPATPPIMTRDARWYLQRSRELRDAGQFAEAIAHRFMALLMELDRLHVLTFHPAKTPAEYVTEVPAAGPGHARFGRMVDELYQCLFGGTACTADTWAAFDTLARDVRSLYAPH